MIHVGSHDRANFLQGRSCSWNLGVDICASPCRVFTNSWVLFVSQVFFSPNSGYTEGVLTVSVKAGFEQGTRGGVEVSSAQECRFEMLC